jgi:hypothetical protein
MVLGDINIHLQADKLEAIREPGELTHASGQYSVMYCKTI